jgi:hypothetical protein
MQPDARSATNPHRFGTPDWVTGATYKHNGIE